MRDVLPVVTGWVRSGQRVALATVVATWRSAPRPAGAAMAVNEAGEVVGSVSGGCVEGAVHELAEQLLAGSRGPTLERYGVSDDDAFAVGLTCGGVLDVFVEVVDAESFPALAELAAGVAAGEPVALATVVSGPSPGRHLVIRPGGRTGSLGTERLDDAVAHDAGGMLDAGRTGLLHHGAHGERRGDELAVLVQSFAPPPRMIVFGAIDFAAAVVRVGAFLGFRVTLCDARPVFATPARFPEADEVVVAWPHEYLTRTQVDERTVICVLTHDPKFDVPLLEVALRSPAAYVGAMGSRRTHEERLARLRDRGVGADAMARLSSPIGLDLGARTPEETAVSIAAEIVAARHGGSGKRLAVTSGPIHHEGALR